jgi:hypothetical protein
LAGLSRLTNRLGLEDLLTRVATYAVRAILGADGAGLTLLEDDRANTIVATAEFVSEIDDIQCGIGQGPCITAAREGQTVMSGSLGSDPRWRNRGPCTRGPAGEGTPSGYVEPLLGSVCGLTPRRGSPPRPRSG